MTLTAADGAQRYLDIVCANNIAAGKLADAFTAGEAEWLNGGAPDPGAVKTAATDRVALNRIAIEQLDDTYFVWPDTVAGHLPHIRTSYMAELSTLNAIANAGSYEDAYYTTWPEMPAEQQAAAQEIRYQLGLSADTDASCVGHENGLNALAAAKADRDAALAATAE
ncbi:hypothetical protein [Salinibacterium sp. ZJ450]|uniref:hypothetical protein n=1 Tax=Salinibacterium sp. ZJ450 TaxID=2708338 RepID=UPI00141FDC6C|nr:hypothetical protein [Salinibacterium sp. ZJ450]